jgi:hypothetical protein
MVEKDKSVEAWKAAVAADKTEADYDVWKGPPRDIWKRAVAAGETLLGFASWDVKRTREAREVAPDGPMTADEAAEFSMKNRYAATFLK